jgi:hypothetical protein
VIVGASAAAMMFLVVANGRPGARSRDVATDPPASSSTSAGPEVSALAFTSVGLAAGVGAAILIVGGLGEGAAAVRASLVALLGSAALFAAVRAATRIGQDAEGEVSFESHWGGLGGDMGGWRVSPALARIALALVLFIMAVGVGVYQPRQAAPKEADKVKSTDISVKLTSP